MRDSDLWHELRHVASEIRFSRQAAWFRWSEDRLERERASRKGYYPDPMQEAVEKRRRANPHRWDAEQRAGRLDVLWFLGCMTVAGVGVRGLLGGSESEVANLVGLIASVPLGVVVALPIFYLRSRWMTSRYGSYADPEEPRPAPEHDAFSAYLRDSEHH